MTIVEKDMFLKKVWIGMCVEAIRKFNHNSISNFLAFGHLQIIQFEKRQRIDMTIKVVLFFMGGNIKGVIDGNI